MASPSTNKVLDVSDPLTPPARAPIHNHSIPSSTSTNPTSIPSALTTPTSFKRRTASKSNLKSTAGLLTGILSRSPDTKPDFLSSPASPARGPPGHAARDLTTPRGREASNMSSYSNALGSDDDAADEGEGVGQLRGGLGARPAGTRISFSGNMQKPKRGEGGGFLSPGGSAFQSLRGGRRISRNFGDEEGERRSLRPVSPGGSEDSEEMEDQVEPTPLPTVSMLVLCICMFGEFLSASLSSPFLYFMIEDMGVGQGPNGGGEAAVGAYCGVVSSMFFLSQFLTSLLWVSVANKHGRRVVLFSSLLGNGLSLMAFGTSKNVKTAITTRLAMGLFNGAVGVARSAVGDITDPTNSGRAYTYMGLSWGLGGIVGSVIGGLTENPVRNYPWLFGESQLFLEYPYLLPCLIAGSVTVFGAGMSLFLGPDGGPREGSIRLPNEKDVGQAASTFAVVLRFVFNKITALWHRTKGQGPVALDTTSGTPPPLPSPLPSPALDEAARRAERDPLASRRASNKYGSAFGPGQAGPGSAFSRVGASGYDPISMRIPSMRRRSQYRTASVMTGATSTRYAPDFEEGAPASFAERFLLSNNNRTFNLAELWVAGKTREAGEEYAQSEYDASVFDPTTATDVEAPGESRFSLREEDHEGEPDFRGYGSVVPSLQDLRAEARRQDQASEATATTATGHTAGPSTDTIQALDSGFERGFARDRGQRIFSGASVGRPGGRRLSMASSFRGASIFSNTGLDPQTLAQAMAQPRTPAVEAPHGADGLLGIPEGRPASIVDLEANDEPEPTTLQLIWQLPVGVIAQYGLVALHGTSCDQVFLSFIVTPISSGGLGLKASDYAGLIALMFFFQMVWQFKFYPNVGPPNGPFSHLAMFRIGLCLYIPVYLLFPQLRGLLPKNGSGEKASVLFGMALLSSMRYLASCCSYTAVMVLVNALSPPDLIPLANGIGQTTVSFARFVGPLIGGSIWAESISGESPEPSAGFVVIAGMCLTGLLLSLRIK